MNAIQHLPQNFRLRLERGGVAHVVFRFDGAHEMRFENTVTEQRRAREILNGQSGYATMPDPGYAFAEGCLRDLGGGAVFDLREPATVELIRKACEIPEDALS